MIIPWEIYQTRRDALLSLGNLTEEAVNDAGQRIATPSFLVAHDVCGVLCVQYDRQVWNCHYGELQKLLRSLPAQVGRDRVILDFDGSDQLVSTATLACIYSLYRPVTEICGRFALCGLTECLLDFFRWRIRELISLRSNNTTIPVAEAH